MLLAPAPTCAAAGALARPPALAVGATAAVARAAVAMVAAWPVARVTSREGGLEEIQLNTVAVL